MDDLKEYHWPDLSGVQRQYLVCDDRGRLGVASYTPARHDPRFARTLWAHPIDVPAQIDGAAVTGIPNAVLMTSTSWDQQPDGRFRGLWYDYDGAPGRVPPEKLRYITIVADLGWLMPDRWADEALAGSEGIDHWNYGAHLGRVGGEPPVKGQTGDEMTVAQAIDYAGEVGETVTPAALRRAAANGEISGARKVGREWLLTYEGVNHYIDSRPSPSLAEAGRVVAANAGHARSAAKSEAARANGRKGGRPKKTPPQEVGQ